MLPGAMHKPEDIIRAGFIVALRERGLPVSVVVADAHDGYYLDRNVVERLTEDIVVPARKQGYRDIWLMGISLGGLGALMCARAHREHVQGVVVLAPYLGAPGTLHEVVRAGGLKMWQPGELAPTDDERHVLDWLRESGPQASLPPIHLGYGEQDRFISASVLLRECLPRYRVAAIPGGHDWPTWLALWQLLLDRGLFAQGFDAQQGS
ncbi:MAG: hypothetical protein JWN13_1427 [Betaproteobacteria bacterium]|nr:hypothetical protein [Betaproteobacteria bacterium]